MRLSGDTAYELYMSSDLFPLHTFLVEWKENRTDNYSGGYVLAVIGAYNTMCANCEDGRYDGKVRKAF